MFKLADIYRLSRKTEDIELLFAVIYASHEKLDLSEDLWNDFGGEDPASFLGLE